MMRRRDTARCCCIEKKRRVILQDLTLHCRVVRSRIRVGGRSTRAAGGAGARAHAHPFPPQMTVNAILCFHSAPRFATRLKFALGLISSLRGVQLLIITWWLCGVSFQRAAVAREVKQKFLSYYFVFPSANLQKSESVVIGI
jgi:hypothetical protein